MILDIIFVVLLLITLLYGYKKGFIGIVMKLVSVIIAFILAYLLAEVVGIYLSNTSFGTRVQLGVSETIVSALNSTSESSIVTFVREKLQLLEQEQIKQKICGYIFNTIGFISVYIVSRIILFIAQKIIEAIFELPILKIFNKLGGITTAIVLFIVEISIVLAVIHSMSTLTFMTGIVNSIEASLITKWLYNHNIVTTLILSKIF